MIAAFIASIPSPNSGAIHIGPLQLRAYGFMIALGVAAGVWLLGRRLEQRGWGTNEDAGAISLWAVLAGVLGARAYHVITDWQRFEHNLAGIPKIWEGGLGIPGGLIVGIPVGVWVAKRRGLRMAYVATAAAPAIPLAQAIGRWGNWWNQELFGRATTLPWGLEIDERHLPPGAAPGTTFHPAFLYESLGNFALCGILLLIDRYRRPRPGRLMAMYLMGYALLRFVVESLRIDPAHKIAGLRVNTWMSILVFVSAAGYLVWDARRPWPPEGEPVDPTADAEVTDDDVADDDVTDVGETTEPDRTAAELALEGADPVSPPED